MFAWSEDAALRWNEHFTAMCKEFDFEPFQGGTIFKRKYLQQYLSVHIDDIILVSDYEGCLAFTRHFEKQLKMKMEGPFSCEHPGVLYYLKRQIEFTPQGIYISPNSKYVPKLLQTLHLEERRPRTTPQHVGLDVYDAETLKPEDFLSPEQSKVFRSALGICLYMAQDRYDIQFPVRLLASYMSKPTLLAMAALKKLASYLAFSKDMRMFFPNVKENFTVFTRWKRLDLGEDCEREIWSSAQYNLEIFSDSDWATSKVSRRSTLSCLVYLNGCCIYSHSRAQTSIALSSMEAEVLAATSLAIERIYLKVKLVLFVDSASAQCFFERLGPGRAKHLATRLLWTQAAVRKSWFALKRIATKFNPSDLNTKSLSRERREMLCRLIGMESECFQAAVNYAENAAVRRVAKVLIAMAMSLPGCGNVESFPFEEADIVLIYQTPMWIQLVLSILIILVIGLFGRLTQRTHELERCKTAWVKIREVLRLKRRENPFVEPCQEENSESESLRSSRQRSISTPRGEPREVREADSTPAIPTVTIPSTEIQHASDGEESDEDCGGEDSEKDEKSEKSEHQEGSSHGSGGYTSRERTPTASTPIVLRERHETRDDRPPLPRRPTAQNKAKAEPKQRPEPIATSSVVGHRMQHTEDVMYISLGVSEEFQKILVTSMIGSIKSWQRRRTADSLCVCDERYFEVCKRD